MRRPPVGVLLTVNGFVLAAGLVSLGAHEPGDDSQSGWRVPPVAEAKAVLDGLVAKLKANPTVEAYCAGDSSCAYRWQVSGGDKAVPTKPPHVLRTWSSVASQVLVLCGRDGLGRPYRTDFTVHDNRGRTETYGPVFWDNTIYEGFRSEGPVIISEPSSPTPYAPPSNPPECG